MKIEFFHQIGPMLFHCLDADAEILGDLLVSVTFSDQFEDLPFPLGKGLPGGLRI